MKPIMLIGIALIILGVVALTYHGVTYTTHEKVLQIGPIEATKRLRRQSRFHRSWAALRLQVELCWSLLGPKSKP